MGYYIETLFAWDNRIKEVNEFVKEYIKQQPDSIIEGEDIPIYFCKTIDYAFIHLTFKTNTEYEKKVEEFISNIRNLILESTDPNDDDYAYFYNGVIGDDINEIYEIGNLEGFSIVRKFNIEVI